MHYFLDQVKALPAHWRIAAIGRGTAQSLKAHGIQVAFIGKGKETLEIAAVFKELVGTEKVLFPMALESLRTVQSVFSPQQVVDLPVYKTNYRIPHQLPEVDVMVFTSPSNVRSFVMSEKPWPDKLVAIGNATAKALEAAGCQQFSVAWAPDELALSVVVNSL